MTIGRVSDCAHWGGLALRDTLESRTPTSRRFSNGFLYRGWKGVFFVFSLSIDATTVYIGVTRSRSHCSLKKVPSDFAFF